MMQGLYVEGETWIHRLPAGLKLLVLVFAGWGLMWVTHPPGSCWRSRQCGCCSGWRAFPCAVCGGA